MPRIKTKKTHSDEMVVPSSSTLSSKPLLSAAKVAKGRTTYSCIYLDFDGQTVTNANWNGGATLVCAPTIVDHAPVLLQVRYAFAAYNVVITDDEAVFLKANRAKRIRLIITPTSSWKLGVSGIAYNGSMFWGNDTPAFVFSDRLYDIPHHIGEIAVHEAGHAIGLNHSSEYDDTCGLTATYKMGDYMGNSLYVQNGVWGISEIACNTFQDTKAFLASKLG